MGRCARLALFALGYAGYLLLGALVLSAVERPHESRLRAELRELKAALLRASPCLPEPALERFLAAILRVRRHGTALLGNGSDAPSSWDFASAFFFSSTLVTTVGESRRLPPGRPAGLVPTLPSGRRADGTTRVGAASVGRGAGFVPSRSAGVVQGWAAWLRVYPAASEDSAVHLPLLCFAGGVQQQAGSGPLAWQLREKAGGPSLASPHPGDCWPQREAELPGSASEPQKPSGLCPPPPSLWLWLQHPHLRRRQSLLHLLRASGHPLHYAGVDSHCAAPCGHHHLQASGVSGTAVGVQPADPLLWAPFPAAVNGAGGLLPGASCHLQCPGGVLELPRCLLLLLHLPLHHWPW